MKKIDLLIKGRKIAEKLFGTKKKGIKLALETAKNNLEQQRDVASDNYENALLKLADDNSNYKAVINEMIGYKQTITDAESTIELINSIQEDLESEVEE